MTSPAAPWKRMYDDVKMHIPGLTDAVFQQMLYHVMNDFLDQTNAWVEDAPITVGPSATTYPFGVTVGEINRLLVVYDPASGGPRKWVHAGIQMTKPGELQIMYAPSTDTVWNASVAKTLGDPAASNYPDIPPVDQWIVDKYGDGIEYGILGRLMNMPAKPYSNKALAKDYWQTYIAERSRARANQLHANVYNGQSWHFPQAFATVSRKGWV